MNDRRIHEIINESINDLLISEGLFGNKTLTYVKQIADSLNDTLSSLSKGVSLNQIVFKPNNGTSTNNYQNNPYQQNNQSQEANTNDDGIISPDENEGRTNYDGDALDVQEAKGGRGRRRRNVKGNLGNKKAKPQPKPQPTPTSQYQPQPQQQLTPQQQQIQSNVPEVVRCWSWGRQILSETVALLKQYLELNGIKESLFYDGMLVEDGANGTMVNPMQILRGGWQSGKSGYMRGYRQAQNLINKINRMRDRYKQQKATLKVIQRIENNVKEYFNFCSVVENCQQQIAIVSANIVFGQEIEHDIEVMTSSEIKGYYQNILKYVVPTNNKKQQKKPSN